MTGAPLPNIKVPFMDPGGNVTLAWWKWFQQLAGATGTAGPEGPSGPEGRPGTDIAGILAFLNATDGAADGAAGPQGAAGFPGFDGADGDDMFLVPGPTGLTGATGAVGPAGSPGPAGIDGDEGEQGRPGNIGPQGPAGATGPQGVQGIVGNDGDEGPEGFHIPGPVGLTGATGATGAQGSMGFALDGDEGPEGMPITPNAVMGPGNFTTLAVGGPLQDAIGNVSVYSGSVAAGITILGDGTGANNRIQRFSTDAISGNLTIIKARGSLATPLTAVASDVVAQLIFQAYDGTANRSVGQVQSKVNTVTGTDDISGDLRFLTRSNGVSAAQIDRLRIDKDGLITVSNGATAVLDQNGGFYGVQASAYTRVVVVTGFARTVANSVSFLILDPAGTLATGTVTMPAAPLDGHEVTISSSQIITALTVSANTGQTMDGTITTLAANAFAKWKYVLAVTTWYRAG